MTNCRLLHLLIKLAVRINELVCSDSIQSFSLALEILRIGLEGIHPCLQQANLIRTHPRGWHHEPPTSQCISKKETTDNNQNKQTLFTGNISSREEQPTECSTHLCCYGVSQSVIQQTRHDNILRTSAQLAFSVFRARPDA